MAEADYFASMSILMMGKEVEWLLCGSGSRYSARIAI